MNDCTKTPNYKFDHDPRDVPVPTWETIQEAKKLQGGGWVYAIDARYDKDEGVPSSGIVGAWEVSPEGKIIGKFVPNPNYVKS